MSTAAATSSLTRTAAQFLVERAERQTGSRMAAYHKVAQNIGTSADWLRKFIKGSEAKEPGWTVGWNLIEHCNRVLCTCVELEMEKERSRIETLKRELDAATSAVNRVVATAQGAQAPGAAPVGPFLGRDP
jgi:hypothetical protein